MAITVTGVSPNNIPALAATPISLTGTSLLTVTKVEMYMGADGPSGAVPCAFTLGTDTAMTMTSFAAPKAGSGVIRLNSSYVTGVTITAPAPVITAVSPQVGNAGDVVTLTGQFLDTVTAAAVGGIGVPISSQSPTSLTFAAPSNLVGVQSVVVVNGSGTGQAVFTYAGAAPPVLCARRAWLTLGAATMPLEDETQGYFLTELDLGYPTVRDVTDNRPDLDGITDRTKLFGERVVSANIIALASSGARIDAVASMFAPFMSPAVRPTLHYVLDRPGASERTMLVRASGYSWPLDGAQRREIQLQWVAADPTARDATVQSATAWAGSSSIAGRTYNLTFPRTYPAGGGSPSTGLIRPGGDVAVRPLYRIYGPVTAPDLRISATAVVEEIKFAPSFTIAAGHYVDCDSDRRTVLDDTGASQFGQVQWAVSTWGALSPGTSYSMNLLGSSTSGVTQVVATWQDAYLT